MKKQFAVIGLGRFGSSVACTLGQLGYQVIAIDGNLECVDSIKDHVTYAKQVNATDIDALRQAGIANCDTAVVAMSGDEAIITTVILREMGIKNVIAKARDEIHALALQKVGATKVVFPEKDSGVRLANQLVSSDILEFIEISKEYTIEEIKAPERFYGKTIQQIDVRNKYGVSIIAIKRNRDLIIVPSSSEKINKGDIVMVIGKNEHIKRFTTVLE